MKSQSFKTIKKLASRFCATRRGRRRRMLLAAFFTGGSLLAAAAPALAADGPPPYLGGISILVHEFVPETNLSPVFSKDHDSLLPPTPLHRTSTQFSQSIAAAVSASADRIGIPVEQFLEPYAVVGRLGSVTPDSSTYPLRPIESAPLATTSLEKSPAADEKLDLVATSPADQQQQTTDVAALDCWWLGEDALNWIAELSETDELFLSPTEESSDLVADEVVTGIGSAPVIATIPDAYFPYDIAQRDIELDYLALTTVQPIRPKNYVALDNPPHVENAAEIAIVEPEIQSSPECLLEELIHDTNEFAEQNSLHELTLMAVGETVGSWFASTLGETAETEQLAEDSSDEPVTLAVLAEGEEPVADGNPPADAAAEASAVVASVEVVVDEPSTPGVEEVAIAEVITMEIDGELIPAPIADDAPNAATEEQVATDELEIPSVEEVAVAEVVTMEVQSELIAVSDIDAAADADTPEQSIVSETEGPASSEIAVAEIAVAKIVAINMEGDEQSGSGVMEAWELDVIEQLASNEESAPEAVATAADELALTPPVEELTLLDVIETLNQWRSNALATLLTPVDASELPAPEVAEKADTSSDSVIR
ncbi:hypothetical protein [Allorhodopirellula heiligendammensis]|uniref:Uncharacterized protein n=1 Tax=Allorhodopirellula heiligendammensis TaxID=2714739 RepID=A0A5C6BE26_9BACT|nr:hypothetical protein [Allorhodopirellula heiligendammensis]TWU10220.1 hypothetical protein Poly21_51900 [Allorhodopirellula heiligendammensis]